MLKRPHGLLLFLFTLLSVFFIAITWGSYLLYRHRFFSTGGITLIGGIGFALLAFIVPVPCFGGALAAARSLVLRYKISSVETLFLLLILSQFLANMAGLTASELASHLFPLTVEGIKAASLIGPALQAGALYGVLAGARQVWATRKDEDLL